MPVQNVLIEFTSDASGLAPADKALSNLTEGEKKLADQALKTSKETVDGNTRIISSVDKLAAASKSLDKSVVGGAYRNYLKQIQTELGLTQKELIKYVQNARQAAQAAIIDPKANEDVKELQIGVDIMNEVLKEFGVNMDQAGQVSTTLRQRLKEAKDELVKLADAGITSGPAFEKAKEKAGELDDQMRDLNATIKGTGSDTKNLDGLINLAGGIAGGFALAQGAAALFGDESEEMQKALLKVNAAMAILQGLQQIQVVLQKESAAMLLLSNIRTKALALGQQFLAATTMQSTIATNTLRAALIASGIGAFIVILGLAANAMGAFGDETEVATDRANDLAEGIKNLNQELDNTVEAIKRNGALQNEYLQQRGASERKLHENNIAYARAESEAVLKNALEKIRLLGVEDLIKTKQDAENLISIRSRAAANKYITDSNKAVIDEQIKGLQEVSDAFKRVENIQADIVLSNEQFKTRAIQEANKKRAELEKKRAEMAENAKQKELADLKDQVDNQLKALDKEEEQLRIHFENEQDIINRDKQERLAIEKEWDDLRTQMQESFVQSSIEAAKRIAEEQKKAREKELEDIQKSTQQLQNILTVFQKGLSATQGTSALGTALSEIANFGVKAKEVFDNIKAGVVTTMEGIKQIAALAVSAAQNAVNQIYSDASAQRAQIAADEIAALEESKQKELTVKNLTEQQKADIEERYRREERRIKIQAFNADKDAKKAQAQINGALAATLALAEYAWPYSLIVAGIIEGLTQIQVAEINRQQPPRFKHGKINIDGPGTTTSDSIHAMISKGESVINAKQTAKYQDALEAINNDQFESFLMNKFGNFSLPQMPELISTSTGAEIDYEVLSTAIANKMKGVIPPHKSMHFNIDKDGLIIWVEEEHARTEIKNKRYSMS